MTIGLLLTAASWRCFGWLFKAWPTRKSQRRCRFPKAASRIPCSNCLQRPKLGLGASWSEWLWSGTGTCYNFFGITKFSTDSSSNAGRNARGGKSAAPSKKPRRVRLLASFVPALGCPSSGVGESHLIGLLRGVCLLYLYSLFADIAACRPAVRQHR